MTKCDHIVIPVNQAQSDKIEINNKGICQSFILHGRRLSFSTLIKERKVNVFLSKTKEGAEHSFAIF